MDNQDNFSKINVFNFLESMKEHYPEAYDKLTTEQKLDLMEKQRQIIDLKNKIVANQEAFKPSLSLVVNSDDE